MKLYRRVVVGIITAVFIGAVVVAPVSALGLFKGVVVAPAQTAQANLIDPWFNSSWQYRRAITVPNANAQNLTDYQATVTLSSSNFNFSQSSGNDIRFTDSDGTTVLSHWTDQYNAGSQTGSFVVKVPLVAASTTKTIYMYYGNPAAPNVSSGARTFAMHDGFERLRNAATPSVTPTYDGSGQMTHPDIVKFDTPWNGYKYWLAITPYAGSNDQLENPSILASNDGNTWVVPAGVTNPLAPAPVCDHNSDVDMIYNDDTGELWMYYLDTRRAARCAGQNSQPWYDHNLMKMVKSSDGVHWSSPVTVADWPLTSNTFYLSPSIVKRGNTFQMWAVNGRGANFPIVTGTSSNGLNFTTVQNVNINQPAWHTDVEYIPSKNEFWMINSYGQATGSLYYAKSSDGQNWTTYPATALSPSKGWDANLYRSTFLYDKETNQIRVWYAAYSSTTPAVWRLGQTAADYDAFVGQLATNGGWTQEAGTGIWATTAQQAKRGQFSSRLIQSGTTTGTSMQLSKPVPFTQDFYLEADMYDDMDTTAFKMLRSTNASDQRVGVGVWTGSSATKYVFHNKSYGYTATSVNRTAGWHKFGMLVKADSSVTYFVDGQNVGTATAQFNNASQAQIEGYNGGTTTFYIDDIRVRKWAAQEPVTTVGAHETQ